MEPPRPEPIPEEDSADISQNHDDDKGIIVREEDNDRG